MRRSTLTAVTFAGLCGLGLAQAAQKPLKGQVERIKVHGASLQGNLEGDSPDREVSIYLPPSYESSPNRRYPVLYILHGFTDSDDHWFGPKPALNLPALFETDLDKGKTREMILVMPNAYTRYAGSFYGSSAATGDWDTFVTQELVAYIDGHYRTLAAAANRGLAGHSMGGYGAIRLAMKHPEVYSSVYAMSACCLTPDIPSAETTEKAEAVRTVADFDKADFSTKVAMGLAAAWSANTKKAPYFDLPRKDGKPQPFVVAEWYANSPTAMLGQYAANLKRLHALALDIGLQDGLLAENQFLDRLLTDQLVPHTLETYEGTHTNKIGDRMETKVLPFFTKSLSFDAVLPSH